MNWQKDDIFLSKWLNGELSQEEQRTFEATEEGQDFVRMMKAASLIKPSFYNTGSEFSKLQDRIKSGPQKKQKVIWMMRSFQFAVAASVALIIVVVYLFALGDKTIKTGFSEQEIVLLPDGSEVKLNAASQLSYDAKKWDKQRTLELDGEAFFKVKKGSGFNVKTDNGNVQVLGTSFNVKSRGGMLNVTCYTGKVEVTSQSIIKQLDPGETIRVKNGEMIEFKEIDLQKEPSWTRGVTELENVSLPIVLNELSYVFGLTIQYDDSLDHLMYTGAFPNQQTEVALRLVFEPLNINYSYDPPSKKLVIIGLNR
ncbi:FecR domain-containing protein [Fulvivirgaceae bacterium BMA10]|uniref:FecR domain-containing protein n=1 Tax=Splendidivirga corallicola TaxID=3051826 RepID=A0ABT8KSS3_9BACT|nr:FecR domain-containing protein [Fulvivirgaceae bacterium BMA10]